MDYTHSLSIFQPCQTGHFHAIRPHAHLLTAVFFGRATPRMSGAAGGRGGNEQGHGGGGGSGDTTEQAVTSAVRELSHKQQVSESTAPPMWKRLGGCCCCTTLDACSVRGFSCQNLHEHQRRIGWGVTGERSMRIRRLTAPSDGAWRIG